MMAMTDKDNPAMLTRRATLIGLAACGAARGAAAAAASVDGLTIAGMPSTPSIVVARLIAAGALAGLVDKPALKIWRTADQMRTGVISGDMKVFAAPSYSAANMFNRGVPLRQVDILTWGLVYLMSRDPQVRRIEDLAGHHILVPSRNDAPDLIFRLLLRRAGMNADQDLKLQYVGTPTEAMQLFLAGRADCALTPEPAASAAEMRATQAGITIQRAIDLTEAYGRASGRPPRLPQAGLVVAEDLLQAHPDVVAALHAGAVDAAHWVAANPTEAGRIGAGLLGIDAAIVERSLPHFRLEVVDAAAARADLEGYFSDLIDMSPDIVGGRLPEARFYWSPAP
jgi:NitT/TauT family transport system substrate-binding protein